MYFSQYTLSSIDYITLKKQYTKVTRDKHKYSFFNTKAVGLRPTGLIRKLQRLS